MALLIDMRTHPSNESGADHRPLNLLHVRHAPEDCLRHRLMLHGARRHELDLGQRPENRCGVPGSRAMPTAWAPLMGAGGADQRRYSLHEDVWEIAAEDVGERDGHLLAVDDYGELDAEELACEGCVDVKEALLREGQGVVPARMHEECLQSAHVPCELM